MRGMLRGISVERYVEVYLLRGMLRGMYLARVVQEQPNGVAFVLEPNDVARPEGLRAGSSQW
eukprot:SAG31_NODE_432_length_15773_cov_7.563892_5_plen_62_part_00